MREDAMPNYARETWFNNHLDTLFKPAEYFHGQDV
jgi:hypothetical protein